MRALISVLFQDIDLLDFGTLRRAATFPGERNARNADRLAFNFPAVLLFVNRFDFQIAPVTAGWTIDVAIAPAGVAVSRLHLDSAQDDREHRQQS